MYGLADSNINATTIWTPSTGFLNTPGTLANGYQSKPQVTSVYDVPGLLLPYESCIDSQGQTAGGGVEACVGRNLATQQQNFKRTTDYSAGALKIAPPAAAPPAAPTPPATNTTPATTKPPSYTAPAAPQAPAGSGPLTNYVPYSQQAVDLLTTDAGELGGFHIPVWALIAAGAGALYVASRGRR